MGWDDNDGCFPKTPVERLKEEVKLLQEELFILKKEIEDLRQELRVIIKPNYMNESSIGNEGVPADQPTHKPSFNTPLFPVDGIYSGDSSTSSHNPAHIPTHLQHIGRKIQQITSRIPNRITPEMVEEILAEQMPKRQIIDKNSPIADLAGIMNTLKADLKAKFRSLTGQEFYIFSVLYTVEKSQDMVTYIDIAKHTGLTSSSIRDYIQRIIRKGIPIAKEKLNNKVTMLRVPPELRNLATLDNLMRLRNDIPDESLDRFSSKK